MPSVEDAVTKTTAADPITCDHCGGPVTKPAKRASKRRFCSMLCKREGMRPVMVDVGCRGCDVYFQITESEYRARMLRHANFYHDTDCYRKHGPVKPMLGDPLPRRL